MARSVSGNDILPFGKKLGDVPLLRDMYYFPLLFKTASH